MLACHIPIKPARITAYYLSVICCGAMLFLWSVLLPIPIKLLLSLLLLLTAYFIYQHYYLSSGPLKLTQITLNTNYSSGEPATWECKTTHSQKTRYHCHPRAYLSPSWLLIRLIPEQAIPPQRVKPVNLTLHKSQVSSEHWRDLHVCVRSFSVKKQTNS